MPLNLLCKFPSRGRPERFFKSLDSFLNNVQDTDNYRICLTLDEDDETMNCEDVIGRLLKYKSNGANLYIDWGLSSSKVHAINRGVPDGEWDIILVHSDDMLLDFYGFDEIIRQEFREAGLDTLLHLPDNDAKEVLATMFIAGRDFYNRFGHIYHPSYKSLWCDNEIHCIAKMLGRYRFANIPGVVTHLNPAYGHLPKDNMFEEQQAIGWSEDKENYDLRASQNFGLHEAVYINPFRSR